MCKTLKVHWERVSASVASLSPRPKLQIKNHQRPMEKLRKHSLYPITKQVYYRFVVHLPITKFMSRIQILQGQNRPQPTILQQCKPSCLFLNPPARLIGKLSSVYFAKLKIFFVHSISVKIIWKICFCVQALLFFPDHCFSTFHIFGPNLIVLGLTQML